MTIAKPMEFSYRKILFTCSIEKPSLFNFKWKEKLANVAGVLNDETIKNRILNDWKLFLLFDEN